MTTRSKRMVQKCHKSVLKSENAYVMIVSLWCWFCFRIHICCTSFRKNKSGKNLPRALSGSKNVAPNGLCGKKAMFWLYWRHFSRHITFDICVWDHWKAKETIGVVLWSLVWSEDGFFPSLWYENCIFDTVDMDIDHVELQFLFENVEYMCLR